MRFMIKQKKFRFTLFFITSALAAVFAGCAMGFVNNSAKSDGTGSVHGTADSNTVFNSKWIISQQERHDKGTVVREGYSIVKTVNSFNPDSFTALNGGVAAAQDLHDGYLYFLIKTESDAAQFRTAVRTLEGVLYAQPDYHYDAPAAMVDNTARPQVGNRGAAGKGTLGTADGNLDNDPKAALADWGLTATGALEAFKRYDAKYPVLASIIDTGVNSLHEDFYDKNNKSIILYAKSSLHRGDVTQYTNPIPISLDENWDNHGHGTHCSGTIAAVGNNGIGICGVSHANTKLITYRGLDASGGDTYATYSCLGDLAEIITELRKEPGSRNSAVFAGLPPDVINYPQLRQKTVPVNLSLGGPAGHPYEVEMMNKALAAGVLPVIAMGNDGKALAEYPAALQGILAVGATAMDDTRAAFSNGGTWMSVCAPGESIYSCGNGGQNWANPYSPDVKSSYRWMSGTSMATPFVTGVVTYLLSINPDLSPYQIKALLENTADKIDRGSPYGQYDSRGFSKWYGYGRVNVLKAAEALVTGSNIPAEGSVYSEKAVIITLKKAGAAQTKTPVWLYEKATGICAAVGLTDETNGIVRFYGLRTGLEYEIGVNDAGTYKTYIVTATNDSDIDYTFLL